MAAFDDLIPSDTVVTDDPFADLIPQPVIRLAPPGSLRPDDLVPAIRKIGGEIVLGQRDETHPDIIDRTGLKAVEIDQRGFAGPQGEFYDRESAAQATQLPTGFEPGRLHSTDLIREKAVLPPGWKPRVTAEQMLLDPVTGLKRPSGMEPGTEFTTALATGIAPPSTAGEVAHTVLSEVANVPTYISNVARGLRPGMPGYVEPKTSEDIAAFGEALQKPFVPLPKFEVKRDDSAFDAGWKEIANFAMGLPEFFESPLGLMTMGAAGTGRAGAVAVRRLFLADMAQKMVTEYPELLRRWPDMTAAEKTRSVIDLSGTALLTGALASPEMARVGPMEPVRHEFAPPVMLPAMAADLTSERSTIEKGPEYAIEKGKVERGGEPEHPQAEKGGLSVEAGDRDRAGEPAPVPEERPAQGEVLLTGEPERIVSTAWRLSDGTILTGKNPNTTHARIVADWEETGAPDDQRTAVQSGFKTSTGRFVDENEAARISQTGLNRLGAEHLTKTGNISKANVELQKKFDAEDAARQQSTEPAAAAAAPAEPKVSAALPESPGAISPSNQWMDLVKANPILSDPTFTKDVNRWNKLYEISQKSGMSKEEAQKFIAFFMQNPVVTPKGKTLRILKTSELWSVYEQPDGSWRDGPGEQYDLSWDSEAELRKSFADEGIEIVGTAYQHYEPPSGQPLKEGPGAASVTDFPKEAQIEQLAREVGRVKGEKAPLLDRVKEAFSLGRQQQAAGDLVTRTLSGLKTAGDYLINTWRGPTKLDDILRVKGELSAELETRSWRLRQAMRDLKQAVPQTAVREAIAKWVDAGGDETKLRAALDTVPANRKAAYQRALNLTPDEKLVAGHIQSYFEARLQEAIDAGVLEEGIDDYIHRIYPKDTPWRRGIVNAIQNGLLDTRKPGLARQRVFELDADAERAGYQPISDFLPRLIEYEASLSKAIASRAAVKRFSEVKMADGRPMLDVAGMGTPIEDPATGTREATLIKPKFKPGQDQFDADGNPTLNYRKDYVGRDYPALRKWRWATADPDGKPIFVQGDVLIHPDAVKRMDKLLQPSQVREYGAARAAMAVGSAFKQTMLDLSGFHQVQITVHGLEHKVNPFRLIQDIDFTNPDIQGLLRGGLTLGGDARSGMYQEGLVGRSLTRLVPGLGDLLQSYHEWLFQSYIPRMKTTMALHALERNKARFAKDLASGRITPDVLYHQTAKEANAAFGELNYIMLERSKTAQDLSRLTLLAPDFLEARGRFALQAGTRLGGEQRMALLLGALTMYITARLANKVISGEYHNEPENLFSIVYNGKAYSLRTVQGDILHALEEPLRFWLHRLNPTLTRPLLQMITQRDEFGRKRTFWQIMGDSISNIVPISLRRSREQQWHTSLLNAFGGSVRRDSDVRRVYDAAAQYKKAHGIRGEPGEFIYDPASDVYRPLKLAILDGNTQAAATEYRKLIDSKTLTARQAEQHFTRYARSPFTGSQKNEKKFFRSLSKEMQLQYEGAKQEKLRVLKGFRQARSLAASPKSTGAFDDLIPAGQ